MRLLLVEDNSALADWLGRTLQRDNYVVDWLDNGADADLVLRSEVYDLVLLDLDLPQLGGTEVLRRMRARKDRTPVLILSADNRLSRRVSELDQGADDYVSKPFEVEELEARIRVMLRRSSALAQALVVCGGLSYDTNTHECTVHGQGLALTPRERAVLEIMALKIGVAVSKATIAQSLFSLDDEVSVDAIEIYIHRLRKKLEGSGAAIVTLRGLGYVLQRVHDGA